MLLNKHLNKLNTFFRWKINRLIHSSKLQPNIFSRKSHRKLCLEIMPGNYAWKLVILSNIYQFEGTIAQYTIT